MSKRIDSQKIMLEHSEAKVKLLNKYLDRYLNIISNDKHTKKISVFDLFCGEGIYENGGHGSPLIILNAINKLHELNTGSIKSIPPINVFLNDKKLEKVEKVKSIIREQELHNEAYGKLNFTNKDYKQIIPKLSTYLRNLKDEKAFIFIDPYGYKEIRASEIKALLESNKAEILLFLPIQFMYRFDEKGTPISLKELLEDLVPDDTWKSNNSVYQFIDQFKEAFKTSLGSTYFVDTFTIQKDPNTVYCLYFFSSHIRGFEKMLESKWEIDSNEGKGWKYEKSGNLFSDFKTNKLEEDILKYLAIKPRNNKEIYNFTLHLGFLPKHVNEVLSALQDSSKVIVTLFNGEKARKKAFYISYDYYKEEHPKAMIKLV
ncbi:three-Cys-motif partner protein TcmP [Mucilaginibacter sp. Bleaf8]|uniref:three-Cys-motif partner protein TcmP n=1 Tax=Mucilaginibacter sp. Bleaf8 TaxID=2834430 RepID=UPI001BCD45F4|nr:three-Cys-motif partner protein TcmP [Mucilaginibacter sp. Bleaf8]MBS7564388.1 three-Cys-motif partner protein TcmP [Mucilaginibacter sp. Bleaf8]